MRRLFTCDGGSVVLPDPTLVLLDRRVGGNLIVTPPREVWERSELSADELTLWGFLVAAAGKAMLDVLPQLEGGCINYWDAGNWALNEQAEPPGPKTAKEYRKVHLHLLGRNPGATDRSCRWGEAPIFPDFVDRHTWAATHERLSSNEAHNVVVRVAELLRGKYNFNPGQIAPWFTCDVCSYPGAIEHEQPDNICSECQTVESVTSSPSAQ